MSNAKRAQTMTPDQCKKCLRCLELQAYANMVSVLRAQGSLTTDKRQILRQIAKLLRISDERHRAEVRRAVNDEQLTAIAEQLNGPQNTGTQRWTVEGRRAVPLLPRLKAKSPFATLADSLSLATVAANNSNPLLVAPTDDKTHRAREPVVAEPDQTNLPPITSIAGPRQFTPDRDKQTHRKSHRSNTDALRDGETTCTAACRKRVLSSPVVSPNDPLPAKVVVLPRASLLHATTVEPGQTADEKPSMEDAVSFTPIPPATTDSSTLHHRLSTVALVPVANVDCQENAATGNSHRRLVTVCPVPTVSSSNGPAPPPRNQQTTATLPTTLDDPTTTAKMGVALPSACKTVNTSSRRSDAKFTSKTNVLVVRDGPTSKGVTLCPAAKSATAGAVTLRLPRDILPENPAAPLSSANLLLTSESQTVIQTTNRLSKRSSNGDFNVQDQQLPF